MLAKLQPPPSPQNIADLERTVSHPLKVPIVEWTGGTAYRIHLYGLYWAMHRMLRDALAATPDAIERAVADVVVPEVFEAED
jgi:hypothetical protein